MYKLNLVSQAVAEELAKYIPGIPTENRVLIISPKDVTSTSTGLIIPGQVKEGVPRKGVVLIQGEITDEYKTYKVLSQRGRVVTYGLYAGKELEFDTDLFPTQGLKDIINDSVITVLSMNEIIYSEPNQL